MGAACLPLPPNTLLSYTNRMSAKNTQRIWYIDAIRGIALCCMIVYHFRIDAPLFGFWLSSNTVFFMPSSLFWSIFQKITAGTFLLLSGFSLQLKAEKSQMRGESFSQFVHSVLTQVIRVGAGAGLITLATWWLIPENMVTFGVLHLLASALVLNTPIVWFTGLKRLALPLGLLLILVGAQLSGLSFPVEGLAWLGLPSATFQSYDYFPIVPYWGVTLVGVFLAQRFVLSQSQKYAPTLSSFSATTKKVIHILIVMGQHSLGIYLIHQPILLFILWIARYVLHGQTILL